MIINLIFVPTAAKEEKLEKRERRQKSPDAQKVSGQAEGHESDAGLIEPLERPPSPTASSILSMSGAGGSRKSRRQKQRSKAERKAEQLRRKVLALTPEQFSQEKAAAAAAVAGPSVSAPAPVVQHHQYQAAAMAHPSRDQSPAFSERSDRSGRRGGGGRHWAKRGRPFNPGAMMPWTRYQQAQGNNPQQTAQHPMPTATSSPVAASAAAPRPLQQVAPAAKPPPVGYTSTASADVARLKNLEKSYAEVLRTSNMPKHRRK